MHKIPAQLNFIVSALFAFFARKFRIWSAVWLLACLHLSAAAITFTGVAPNTTSGAVAGTAQFPIYINGTVKAGERNRAIKYLEIVENGVPLATQIFGLDRDVNEIPIDTPRQMTKPANLGVGEHQLYLRATSVDMSEEAPNQQSAGPFTITITNNVVRDAKLLEAVTIPTTMGHLE
ncbi:hypothetical protein [Duganella sp.]|uniref:hypothetical protein n=1 Tax=Duganella sp. TaxID=1904440 RepID=UPI0031D0F1C6